MPLEITVTPEQLGPAVQHFWVELLRQDGLAAVRVLQRAAYVTMATAVKNIAATKPFPPVDTGRMLRSYVVEKRDDGAVLYNSAPYAGTMEFGAKPHFVPLGPLIEWATRKSRGQKGGNPLAWARGTQRAILKRGLAARGFHSAAIAKVPEFLEQALRHELDKLASRNWSRAVR